VRPGPAPARLAPPRRLPAVALAALILGTSAVAPASVAAASPTPAPTAPQIPAPTSEPSPAPAPTSTPIPEPTPTDAATPTPTGGTLPSASAGPSISPRSTALPTPDGGTPLDDEPRPKPPYVWDPAGRPSAGSLAMLASGGGTPLSVTCTVTTGKSCSAGYWPQSVSPSNVYGWTAMVDNCPANGTVMTTFVQIGGWTPVTVSHGAVANGTFVGTRSGSFTSRATGQGSTGNPLISLSGTAYTGRTAIGCRLTYSMAWVSGPNPWPSNGGMPVEAAPDGTAMLENGATAGDPVQTFSGAFLYGDTDVAIAGRGPTPIVSRSYNSADTRDGPLGPGWTHAYAARLREPGDTTGDLLFVRPDGNTDRFLRNPDGTYRAAAATDATLVREATLGFIVEERDRSQWRFDTAGTLTSLRDRHGNTSTLSYNAARELVSVGDPAGRGVLTLAYTDDRLTSVTDWLSPARTVEYEYDAEGRLETVTDRLGETTTYAYHGTSHRLASITDERGNATVTIAYDGQGRVASTRDASGLVTGDETTFDYVVNGDGTRETTMTIPGTSYEPGFEPTLEDHYTAQGWLTSRTTRPTSTETLTESFTYDADGDRTSATDARGSTTDFCYDVDYAGAAISGDRVDLTRIIAPAPTAGGTRPVTLLAYDDQHNVTQTVAPLGVPSGSSVACSTNLSAVDTDYATDRAYDASKTRLLSITTRYTDPDLGLRTAVTKLEYGDAANPGLVTRSIPARGNTTATPDPDHATTFTYFTSGSRKGLLAQVTDPLGNMTSYDHDAVGRLISITDPLGNEAGATPSEHRTTLEYDAEDRLRFVRQPAPTPADDELVSETRYDVAGNPVVRIDAAGQVTTMAYDTRNLVREVLESASPWTDPSDPPTDLIGTEYAYDSAGNPTRVTRAAGDTSHERATDYAFDGRGLLRTERQYPAWPSTSGALVTTAGYDANGNRATLVDPAGQSTTFAYDRRDRLTGIDYAASGTPDVTYGYDLHGARTSMTDGRGTTTYTRDEAGRLVGVSHPGSVEVGYRHDLDGNRTKIIYPGGDAVTYAIDEAGRVASLTDWASRTTSYAYHADGALDTITNPNGTVSTYAWDHARRLTDITHKLGSTTLAEHHYTLDDTGTVTAVYEGALDWTYEYDALSRLTDVTGPDGTRTYAYDPAGNRISRTIGAATTTYTHDRADRLLTAGAASITVGPSGNLTARGSDTFAFDAANRLTSATVLPVVLDDGERRSVWGPTGLAYTVDGSAIEVAHADRLGSIRTLTDGSGSVVATGRTDEFGIPTAATGSTDAPYGYTGEPIDGSGLVHLRARHYDPTLGRFLTRDTWGGDPLTAQTLNRYSYVSNDPLTQRDPSGHCGVDVALDVGFIGLSVTMLVSGPEKDRGTNALALGADIISLAIPCATGLGMIVRGGRAVDNLADTSALAEASAAAFRAADNVRSFTVPRKHQPWAGGGWAKFDASVDQHALIEEALRSDRALFRPNSRPDSYRLTYDAGRTVGTSGESAIRVVVGNDGSIWTAFPVKR
jgi:RHS repeat-associated protein